MKLKNIILTGLALMALTACNDYLEVEAPSKQTNEYIFSRESEVSLALNNIYVQMLSNNTYGQNFWTSLIFNNDVEFAANSSDAAGENNFQRFDGTSQGGNASNAWNQLYKSIETANNFIYNLKQPEMISLTEEENQFSGKFARFINENNIIPIAEETDRAQRDITQNVNARMVFFDYALHIIVLLIQ